MLVLTPYKSLFYILVRERTILNILDIGVKLLLDLFLNASFAEDF